MSWPILYSTDKRGKKRLWEIWIEGTTIFKRYGVVGGKLQERSNEAKAPKGEELTSEMAADQAQKEWEKQCGKGYTQEDDEIPNEKELNEGQCDEELSKKGKKSKEKSTEEISPVEKHHTKIDIAKAFTLSEKADNLIVENFSDIVYPMLADKYTETDKCLAYFDFEEGVYIQPKLHGIRCLARISGGKVVLLSRTGKQFAWLKHIRNTVSEFLENNEEYVVDGELYCTSLFSEGVYLYDDDKFNMLTKICKTQNKTPHPLELQVQYHIYDLAIPNVDQDGRFDILKQLFSQYNSDPKNNISPIQLVPTEVVEFPESVFELHDDYVSRGYEGVIVRSYDLCYLQNKRSTKMRKYKVYNDEEFMIADVVADEDGFGVWICSNSEGKEFRVISRGTPQERTRLLENYEEHVGKNLTIRYSQFDPTGLPYKAVAICVRDYE